MRASELFTALPALWFLVGCAAPRIPVSLDGWRETQIGDVTLLAPLPEAELRRHADAVSVLLGVAARITNVPSEESPVPTRVVLAPPDLYAALGAPRHSAGVAASRIDGNFLAVRLAERPVRVRQVLLHEVAHFLSGRSGGFPYPFWYAEGFAELLSSVVRRDDLVIVGAAPWGALERLRQTRQIDIGPVLGVKRGDAVPDAPLAYALSWAVVHDLSSDPTLRDALARLVELQASGVEAEAAVQRALQMDLGGLSRRVDAHVRRLVAGAPGEFATFEIGALGAPEPGAIRAVAAGEVAWLLGEHASGLAGDVDESPGCPFYALALAEQPDHAPARSASGLCAGHRGDFDAADALIRRALGEAPRDARVQVFAGRLELLRAQRADSPASLHAARAAFERACALEPQSAVAFALLGSSYAPEAEEARAGIAALERARQLGGFDASSHLLLGKLRLRTGDADSARSVLSEVALLDAGGAAGAEAERLLRELGTRR